MNRFRYTSSLVIPALTFIVLVGAALGQRTALTSENHFDKIRERMDWFYRQRAFPLKHIPPGARLKALQQLNRMSASAEKASLNSPSSSLTWTLIGPQPTNPNLNFSYDGAPNVSGRVTALAVDPTNPIIVYLGAAEGGVWKTTNGGTSWTPLTDTQVSLAVGSIAIDPSNHATVYVGTGEGNNNQDVYYGAGILKSTDGGSTWTRLSGPFVGPFGSFNLDGGAFIGALAVSPANSQVLLAGILSTSTTNGSGVYRSADGGNTWTLALGIDDRGTAALFDPTNGNIAYAALGAPLAASPAPFGDPLLQNGIYKSTDGGQTWTKVLLETSNIIGRIALTIAPSSSTTLYAAIADATTSSNSLRAVVKTTDGFKTFTTLTNAPDFCNPQCWYNNVVAVAPNNPNVVYAGGLNQEPNFPDHTVIRSLDGGNSWSVISVGANGGTVHTDTHALAFSGDSSTLYVGSDGGVWSTTNVATAPVNWNSLNSTLALTQFYGGLSMHPTNPSLGFGGAQDNGVQQYTGSLTWSVVACGDGGYTAIDFVTPTTVYADGANGCLVKSTLSGDPGTFTQETMGIAPICVLPGVPPLCDNASFIPPLVMDPSNSSTLYYGTSRVYQTTDGAGTWTPISPPFTATPTGTLTTIAVAPGNSNTVYAGSNDVTVGVTAIAVTTNAGSGASANWSQVSPPCPRFVTDIAVDPVSSTTAYVTYSGFSGFNGDTVGHVFKTTNGSASFSDISGNLPNIPVNAIVVDPDVANTLYIATDIGVFVTSNGGTAWSMLGTGLPNVAVLALSFQHATRTLRAGTHGRSAWDLSLSTVAPGGFSLLSNPSSLNIEAPGQSGSSTITVTGTSGFAGTVSFTCSISPLPANDAPTCLASPSSIALSATTTTATANLRISTTAGLNSGLRPGNRPIKPGHFAANAGLVLACIFFLGAPHKKTRWATSLGLVVLVLMGVALSSCASGSGGSSRINFGTPTGSYTVTLTASGGGTTQTTNVAVTVQ